MSIVVVKEIVDDLLREKKSVAGEFSAILWSQLSYLPWAIMIGCSSVLWVSRPLFDHRQFDKPVRFISKSRPRPVRLIKNTKSVEEFYCDFPLNFWLNILFFTSQLVNLFILRKLDELGKGGRSEFHDACHQYPIRLIQSIQSCWVDGLGNVSSLSSWLDKLT